MQNIVLRARFQNGHKRVLISGIGLTVLTTLYCWGFHKVGVSAVGSYLFYLFCGLSALIGVLRIGLSFIKDRLPPEAFLKYFYLLLSLGSVLWAFSGVYLYLGSKFTYIPVTADFEDFVKIQFFMILGVIQTIPQFLRHTKALFIGNLFLLYAGLLSLVPFYLVDSHSTVFVAIILTFFGVVVIPQYLKNWKTETELIYKEQELQAIIDGFPGAVSEIKNGKYKRINRFLKERIFGKQIKDSDWLGKPIGFMNGQSVWTNLIQDFQDSSAREKTIEFRFSNPEGERTYFSALSKIDDETIVVASIDIQSLVDSRKEVEFQKLQAQEKARLAGLGLMAAGIAHEINNPLSVIRSRTDLAMRQLQKPEGPDIQKSIEFLEKVVPMVERISKIIHSMCNLTRENQGSNKEPFTLGHLIEEIVVLIEEKLKVSNIDFKVEGDAIDSSLFANKGELSQVFVNAINNSVQALNGLEKKWIKIQAEKTDASRITIKIQDAGTGIPHEHRNKVMTPLFTTKNPGEGTGLGLALSKKIIEHHQGQLYFDFQQPHTTLIIELPLIANS